MKIDLGEAAHGHTVRLDIQTLLSTRLLVTADSGGGKTVLLKRLCEQMADKVPIIVLDPEGEFAPLREKYNFVLVGPGGETPADPRSAGLVAQTLLKLKASAVCDIYEMDERVRHSFVKEFCRALINAPKSLWHPTIVIVDEAHMFCPEKGSGESDATEAVKALSTRGRKRGICPIYATQRLAEFNKGASSMCLNRLVGGTFEDVNVQRALQVLSIAKQDKNEVMAQIKLLEPGYFYALGRAISKERILFKVGGITTSHGDAALKYAQTPPPPPAAIAALLPKLADLPKTAEEKVKTETELRKEIRELKAKLKEPVKMLVSSGVDVEMERRQDFEKRQKQINRAAQIMASQYSREVAKDIAMRNAAIRSLERVISVIADYAKPSTYAKIADKPAPAFVIQQIPGAEIQNKEGSSIPVPSNHPERGVSVRDNYHATQRPEVIVDGDFQMKDPEKRVLQAIAEFAAIGQREPTKNMIAAWLGVRADTGSFKRYLTRLRDAGYLVMIGTKNVAITGSGQSATPPVKAPVSTKDLLDRAAKIFGGTAEKMLRFIHENYPNAVTAEEIADHVENKPGTGSFKGYLSDLRSAGLVTQTSDRKFVASEMMFID